MKFELARWLHWLASYALPLSVALIMQAHPRDCIIDLCWL